MGTSLTLLTNAMSFYEIKFKLWNNGNVLVTNAENGEEVDIDLVSSNPKKCEDLTIAEGPLDIYEIPQALKKLGGGKSDLRSYVTRLDTVLGYEISPCPISEVDQPDLPKIEDDYEVNIEVWQKHPLDNKHDRYDYKLMYGGRRYKKTVQFHYVDGWGKLLYILNADKYFSTLYQCPNTHYNCFYGTAKKSDYDRHVKSCQDPAVLRENPICIQKEFSSNMHPINDLIELGLLEKEPILEDHLFYDIESIILPETRSMAQSEILQTHKLLSIAVNSFLDGTHETMVWVVENDSVEAEVALVDKFVSHLLMCEYKRKTLKVVIEAKNKLNELKEADQEKLAKLGQANSPKLGQLKKMWKKLSTYDILNCYGYNSSAYDMKILFKLMLQSLERKKVIKPTYDGGLKLMKKGSKYFSVKFGNIHMKDLMNFSTPMSLSKYLTTWTDTETKLLYPYEHFKTVAEIRACTVFPKYEDFNSTLTGMCDHQQYMDAKREFDRRMDLPAGHEDRWTSFEDYLKWYNISDVKPASKALLNQFRVLRKNFGIDPMTLYGIPSYAQAVMYGMYKKDSPSVFTFPPDFAHLVKIFRKNTVGGITNTYHRHITTMDEDAAYAAKYSKSGKRWKRICFTDINSMYVSTLNKEMPCGRGFDWTCDDDGKFTRKLISSPQHSLQSCIWLEYMSADPRFVDSAGVRQNIRHAWNGSEVKVGQYPVDGYCEVDGVRYALQFDGCHVHVCNKCNGNGDKDDTARDAFVSKHCKLIKISSCEWAQVKKWQMPKPTISPFIFHKSIRSKDIIKAINDGCITGFVHCDIHPTAAAKKYEDISWPPIFRKEKIPYDLLPEWMKVNTSESTFPRETLVQTMVADQILIHTALAAFYIRNGFEINNITRFIEYEGSTCFSDFFDRLYKLRVEATIAKNGPQTAAIKLTGNSSFGKSIQNPIKYTSHSICGEKIYNQKRVKPTFQSSEKLTPTMYEIKELPTKIKEQFPLHIGVAILQLSKLLLAEFITFLERFLVKDSFVFSYTGM